MIDTLRDIDKALLYWINEGWSNPLLDQVMPVWRDKLTWIPLYGVVLGWLIWKYRKQSWPYIILLTVVVIFCDFTSSSILKPWIGRLRPCNNPEVANQINILISCGPGKSFTSSHATNHFGLAVMFGLLFGRKSRWIWVIGLVWAGTIALGQVYVGVHYPADILGGALLGSTLAIILYRVSQKTGFTRTFAGS